jgi:ferredoxin-NADP reductase
MSSCLDENTLVGLLERTLSREDQERATAHLDRWADGERLDLGVERLEDGEVSPYLNGEVRVGDQLELRGPIGGYFVWEPSDGAPVLLIGGGSGVVPLMAMTRARHRAGSTVPMRWLSSSRALADVVYRAELEQLAAAADGFELCQTLTRDTPEGWPGHLGRIDERLLASVAWSPDAGARIYICGPTTFVEAMARSLLRLGHDPATIKTERFGATGAP